MKQKLLTLFVLLVSAMTAFADATGSGVTKGNDSNKNGISYEYQITEQDGDVTFTVTPNLDGIIGYVATYIDDESHLQGDYETKGTTRTWKGLAKGTYPLWRTDAHSRRAGTGESAGDNALPLLSVYFRSYGSTLHNHSTS